MLLAIEDDPRHPGRVGRERLGLIGGGREGGRLVLSASTPRASHRRPRRHRTAGGARAPPRPGCRWRCPSAGSAPRGSPRASRPSERGRTASWAASEVGAWRAGRRDQLEQRRAPGRRRAVRRRTSSRAGRSRRGSGCPRTRTRSSTSSWSWPIAGFSLATRVRSISSSRSSGGSGSGPAPGNSSPNWSSSRPASGPETRLEVGQRGGHRPGLDVRLVAGDQEMADLVEQAEGADLAGLDRRRARPHGPRSSAPPAGGARPYR